ncbi:hypothetical protein [Actinomycetospora aeridis]|uniref:Uncharacterized protein n=1 Tax=Actinomycetospora aeridis TaxID=3129231 RepID=A0ABU8NAN3_9PSEU
MSMPASGANPAVDVGSRPSVLDRWPWLLLVVRVFRAVGSLLRQRGDPTRGAHRDGCAAGDADPGSGGQES